MKIWILYKNGKPFRVDFTKFSILESKQALEFEEKRKMNGWNSLAGTRTGKMYIKHHKPEKLNKYEICYITLQSQYWLA